MTSTLENQSALARGEKRPRILKKIENGKKEQGWRRQKFVSKKMCGIFAYLNYCTPRKRDEILTILIQSIQKLAFKSYDSAGTIILPRSHWSISVELKIKTPKIVTS